MFPREGSRREFPCIPCRLLINTPPLHHLHSTARRTRLNHWGYSVQATYQLIYFYKHYISLLKGLNLFTRYFSEEQSDVTIWYQRFPIKLVFGLGMSTFLPGDTSLQIVTLLKLIFHLLVYIDFIRWILINSLFLTGKRCKTPIPILLGSRVYRGPSTLPTQESDIRQFLYFPVLYRICFVFSFFLGLNGWTENLKYSLSSKWG